jgi:hypothetical protein
LKFGAGLESGKDGPASPVLKPKKAEKSSKPKAEFGAPPAALSDDEVGARQAEEELDQVDVLIKKTGESAKTSVHKIC